MQPHSSSLSHSLSNPNAASSTTGDYRANNMMGRHQQLSGFYQQQHSNNNNYPQQMINQEEQQKQHPSRQSPSLPLTMHNTNNSLDFNNINLSNNRFNNNSQTLQNNQQSNMLFYNGNTAGILPNHHFNSNTTPPVFNTNSRTPSGNNTFSDFFSIPPSKHGELAQNTNLLTTSTTSGTANYQNTYVQSTNNHNSNNFSNLQPANNITNQIYSDSSATNQLQSSPFAIHSPNIHSSSSSDKNSGAVVEPPPPKPKKKTKSKPNRAGQLSFTIPPISEERFDDVSEAVAFSGAKLFPIACQQCRSRHKRCDRTIPSCSSCSSKGIECQYRTPRKKGRALQSNDGFQTFTSLDEIKYIPQSQGFTDNETIMNSAIPSNSISGSPPKDLGIDDIVTKKRKKKSHKNEDSVPKKLAVEKKPAQPIENASPSSFQSSNNSFNNPLLSLSNQMPSPRQDISNRIQIPSVSPSDLYDSPETQVSMVPPSNIFLSNQNYSNNFPSMSSNVGQIDLTPFNDTNSSIDTISQLLVLLLSSNNQTHVNNLVKDLLSNGNGEGLKKLLGATFGLESFITTNERLNIAAIKKRTVDLYDEIISFGYPILSSQYIDEALSATNIKAYSSENLALIYAIHAVTCQRLCELDQANQAYHKSLIELKETNDKHSLVVIATYCNLALYCGGTGDTDTAQQLLASAEIYLINRRKVKLQTNDTNMVLNFIGSTGPSFTLYDNLSDDEFKVEKLKAVCSVAAFLGSGTPKPSLYFIIRGYSFAEEIGSFLSECLLLFEGRISKKDLDILTKPINANTFSDYLTVLSRVDSAYSGHESARPYSSMQMKLAASLLLCVLGGARSWVLKRAGIKGSILEEYATQVTNLTKTQGFLLLHSLTIQFVSKALEIHYETVCDAENGSRKNSDLPELYQTLFTCFSSLIELSKRFTRILRLYPNLLYSAAIKLRTRGFEAESIDLVLKKFNLSLQPIANNNILNNSSNLGKTEEKIENKVGFDFDQLLRNFVSTTVKTPFI